MYKEKRARHYRRSLGHHRGKKTTVECSDFVLTPTNEDGSTYMLLKMPYITKMDGCPTPNNWIIHHLWVQVPNDRVRYFQTYLPLMRKIQIKGIVKEYQYASGRMQVGVQLQSIKVLKYKKHIAKKYQLSPGRELSQAQMDKILKQKEKEK